VLPPLAAGLAAAALLFAQPADGVSVSTDAPGYAPGDPIQVTILNVGPDRISRGGLACTDIWPLVLEQRLNDGTWDPVSVPQHSCIGIAAALVGPGETQTETISLSLDPGTYHVVYAFDDVDNGTQEMSTSDPFDITSSASNSTNSTSN
jgi:hypothetical protein